MGGWGEFKNRQTGMGWAGLDFRAGGGLLKGFLSVGCCIGHIHYSQCKRPAVALIVGQHFVKELSRCWFVARDRKR